LIDVAKERIPDTTKSVSEIACGLELKYLQHFTRLFKQKVGLIPPGIPIVGLIEVYAWEQNRCSSLQKNRSDHEISAARNSAVHLEKEALF